MYNSLTLVPAYGRDYKSKPSLLQDWTAGKDFQICDVHAKQDDGRYTSNRDTLDLAIVYTHLHFRYAKLTKLMVVKL